MALTRLPVEIFENIITHALPEGFESLALTCKGIYALCISHIEHHNKLRSWFENFKYDKYFDDPSFNIKTAFDLITRIAVEPAVARYIRSADFRYDSNHHPSRNRGLLEGVYCGEVVTRLLANSSYLEKAGLDWKKYYADLREQLGESILPTGYSQHAAALLLTFLPNVKTLILPQLWKPLDATDKLIDVIVCETKRSHLLYNRPNLAQVANFGPNIPSEYNGRIDFDWMSPFIALPNLKCFEGNSYIAMGDDHMRITYRGISETLRTVDLASCCIDHMAIADFLKHTPRLRTLHYSHFEKELSHKTWDICKFVTAIEREAGSNLDGLSISYSHRRHSIPPSGKASMGGFKRLRILEFPLEIAMCNVAAAAYPSVTSNEPRFGVSSGLEPEDYDAFICDLVPASVSQLSLLSNGWNHHYKALDSMFRHFAAKKNSQLPALETIYLSYHSYMDKGYTDQCVRLIMETEKAGVVLCLKALFSVMAINVEDKLAAIIGNHHTLPEFDRQTIAEHKALYYK